MFGRILSSLCLVIAYVVLGGAAVGFLTGSSCIYRVCDDDDFDDDFDHADDDDDHHCDDDDDHHHGSSSSDPDDRAWRALAAADPGWFRIEHHTLVVAEDAERLDVRALTDIQGISLTDIAPETTYSTQSLRVFGDRVLAANEALIGLPPARFRQFAGTFGAGNGRGITYDFAHPEGPSGRIRILLDATGRLVSIEKLPDGTSER